MSRNARAHRTPSRLSCCAGSTCQRAPSSLSRAPPPSSPPPGNRSPSLDLCVRHRDTNRNPKLPSCPGCALFQQGEGGDPKGGVGRRGPDPRYQRPLSSRVKWRHAREQGRSRTQGLDSRLPQSPCPLWAFVSICHTQRKHGPTQVASYPSSLTQPVV